MRILDLWKRQKLFAVFRYQGTLKESVRCVCVDVAVYYMTLTLAIDSAPLVMRCCHVLAFDTIDIDSISVHGDISIVDSCDDLFTVFWVQLYILFWLVHQTLNHKVTISYRYIETNYCRSMDFFYNDVNVTINWRLGLLFSVKFRNFLTTV